MSAPEHNPVNGRELKRALRELGDPNPDVRHEGITRLFRTINRAAIRLSGIGCPRNVAEDRRRQHAAVEVFNHPEMAALFLAALQDSSVRVRAFAAGLMACNLTSPDAEQLLIGHLLNDPDPHMRTMCSGALLGRQTEAVITAMIQALEDDRATVVVTACMSLAGSGRQEAVEPLQNLLTHHSWLVRLHACEALISLDAADGRVVTALETLSRQPEAEDYDDMATMQVDFEQEYMGSECQESPTVAQLIEAARTQAGARREARIGNEDT